MTIKLIQTILITLLATLTLNAEVAFNEQTLLANGGDGVAISSEWAFVGDADLCVVHIYRLDYTTMLWGDGNITGPTTVAGIPYQTLGSNCNRGGFRDFGASVSYADDWLFIGAPAKRKDDRKEGSMHLYHFDGTDWIATGNSPYTVGNQGGAFGASVSIRSYDDTTLLAVVGAPYDYNATNNETLSTAPGRAYAYLVDVTIPATPSIVNSLSVSGESANDQYGYSVTSDGTRFLVGAPYNDANGIDAGRVYLYANSTDTNPTTYDGASAGENRGQELSLSSTNYMITTGQTSDVLDGSEPIPSTSYYSAASSGGDASQSNGVVALANKGADVQLYADISSSTVPDITVPAKSANFGEDINLYKDQLIVNGYDVTIEGQAYTYDFPCGIKPAELKAFEWAIVSVPCGDGTAVIGDIFTDDLGVYGDNDNWVMYEQNGTDYNGTFATMRQMLAIDAMELGKGYWIITDADSTWKVDAGVVDVRTSGDGDIVNDGVVIPNETIKKYFIYKLPDSNTTVEQKVMVGNPYPRTFQWENVYFLNGTNGYVGQINDANKSTPYIRPNAYVYDLTQQEATGQPYRSITVNTPGTSGEIAPNQGFWIMLEKNRTGSNDLRIPFEK